MKRQKELTLAVCLYRSLLSAADQPEHDPERAGRFSLHFAEMNLPMVPDSQNLQPVAEQPRPGNCRFSLPPPTKGSFSAGSVRRKEGMDLDESTLIPALEKLRNEYPADTAAGENLADPGFSFCRGRPGPGLVGTGSRTHRQADAGGTSDPGRESLRLGGRQPPDAAPAAGRGPRRWRRRTASGAWRETWAGMCHWGQPSSASCSTCLILAGLPFRLLPQPPPSSPRPGGGPLPAPGGSPVVPRPARGATPPPLLVRHPPPPPRRRRSPRQPPPPPRVADPSRRRQNRHRSPPRRRWYAAAAALPDAPAPPGGKRWSAGPAPQNSPWSRTGPICSRPLPCHLQETPAPAAPLPERGPPSPPAVPRVEHNAPVACPRLSNWRRHVRRCLEPVAVPGVRPPPMLSGVAAGNAGGPLRTRPEAWLLAAADDPASGGRPALGSRRAVSPPSAGNRSGNRPRDSLRSPQRNRL